MKTLRTTLVVLFACLLVAVGTPAHAAAPTPIRHEVCTSPLTAAQRAVLVEASDTSDLATFADAAPRLEVIEATFSANRDHRGIFAIFYKQILAAGATAVSDPTRWQDPQWVERVSRNFVVAYLDNLHGHLTGGAVTPEWRSYYAMAGDCRRSVGRVAAQGLIAHLVVDFPEAIRLAGSRMSNKQDFLDIGDLLIDATVALTADIESTYGQDLRPLFRMFLVGDVADAIAGKPVVTPVFFQAVRLSAWLDGLKLTDWFLAPGARSAIAFKFAVAGSTLDVMEAFALI